MNVLPYKLSDRYYFSPPAFLPLLTGSVLHWRAGGAEKKLYLTFDDGPSESVTAGILKLLDAYHAKATFFCLGKQVERYPELFDRIVQSGHAVGNHTYSHLDGWRVKNRAYIEDVNRCGEILESQLFRPPYGRMSPRQIITLSKMYSIVMWSVLSYDFDQRLTAGSIFRQVITRTKDGAIIAFHDSAKAAPNCLGAVPRVLEYYTGKGFEFASLGGAFPPKKNNRM